MTCQALLAKPTIASTERPHLPSVFACFHSSSSLEVPVYWAVGDDSSDTRPAAFATCLAASTTVILVSTVNASNGRLRPALWNPSDDGGVISVDVAGDAVGNALNEKNQVAGWYLDPSSQQRVAAQFQ